MPHVTGCVVTQAMSSLQQIDIPPVLRDRIDQHHRHLTSLAAALLASGQNSDDVRRTIEDVVESFKGELIRTIDSIMDNQHAV